MPISKEAMGAFIDAVYAIAITILALEIPAELSDASSLLAFREMIPEYGLSFGILFALWVHHRRTNALVEFHRRPTLWLSALAMLAACLIPRATSLVFEYGGTGALSRAGELTLAQVQERAAMVDTFSVVVVVVADLTLLLLAWWAPHERDGGRQWGLKLVCSGLLLVALAIAIAAPVENRYFAVAIPLALIFEDELSAIVARLRKK